MILYPENPSIVLSQIIADEGYDSVFVLCDTNTHEQCSGALNGTCSKENYIIIPPGEDSKNLETAAYIWSELINRNASRRSVLINLGGGTVTDIGGFCASTFQRGISFINVPTTLLGMVDAAIGGKNGIDFQHYKNYIGTINQPEAVIIHSGFLNTLSKEELLNGWAEVLKHAIISGDPLWNWSKNVVPYTSDSIFWNFIIDINISVKEAIAMDDPTEIGKRKILNLGHTIGHAIESAALEEGKAIRHGFCVAAGIIVECYIAYKKGLLPKEVYSEIQATIDSGFKRLHINDLGSEKIMNFILSDKKNHSGKILMALPQDIGSMVFDILISESEITEALSAYSGNAAQTRW